MAWSFDVASNIPRLNQSGTETGLAGIATAIAAHETVARSTAYTTSRMVKPPTPTGFWYRCSTAGTTAASAPTYGTTLAGTTTDGTAVFTAFKAPDIQTLGTTNHYYMPDIRMAINGTLTNTNVQQQNFTCLDLIIFTGNFTSGAYASDGVTPLWDGLHFAAVRSSASGADGTSMFLQSGGQFTFIGGEVQTAGGVTFDSGTTPRSYLTRWRNTKEYGASSARFRSQAVNAIFQNVETYDFAFDLFRMPTVPPSIKARGAEYVYQYVGSSAGGADAKFAASNLENPNGSFDFDNYGSGWVELYNCAKGANLNVTNQNTGNVTFLTRHCVPLYQDVVITAKDTTGTAVQDVRFTATETPVNSPTVTFTTTGSLKTWDFRTPLSYQTATNAIGIATTSPVLNVWYWQASPRLFQQSLRFPASTATYQGRAYNYKTTNAQAVLGASTAVQVTAGMIGLDTATTVSEATALALTGITLTPSGTSGGTLVVTQSRTLQDIWNYYRAWISAYTNSTSEDTWTCLAGELFTGAWNIVIYPGATVTASAAITSIETTSTLTLVNSSTMPYLFNVGGVLQAAGVLVPSTVLGVQDTYSGAGQIQTLYTDVNGPSTTFEFQNISVGSSIVIYDAAGTTKLFQQEITTAGDFPYYIAPGVTGTLNWAIELYGKQRQSGSFAANTGGLLFYEPIYIEDVGISQTTKATVAAYTAIDNLDKFYDYTAYRRLSEDFIKIGQIATRSGTAVEIGAYNLTVNVLAGAMESITGTTITIKSGVLAAGSKYSTIIATPPKLVTAATAEIITAAIEDGAGDSSVTIQGGSGNFTLWKLANATPDDDYATGTNLGNVGNVTYRFLSAAGFKIIIRDNTTAYRISCPMDKGIYIRGLFFGDQVQLAQSAEVTQINTKVDILTNNVAAVPAAVLASTVETGATVVESLRLHNSVLGGVVSGGGSGVETFRDLANTKDRLVSTNTATGDRTAEVYDLT